MDRPLPKKATPVQPKDSLHWIGNDMTFRLPRTHRNVNPIASTRDGGATAPATTAAAPAWAPGSKKRAVGAIGATVSGGAAQVQLEYGPMGAMLPWSETGRF